MKRWLILSLILSLGLVLMLSGCGKDDSETQQPETTTPEPEVAPQPEPEPEPVAPTPTEQVEVKEDTVDGPKIDYGSRGILSDVKCDGVTLSAIITNILDETQTAIPKSYNSDLHIQVNGINMQNFECDKTEIASGEYTYCSDLVGNEALAEKMIRTDRDNQVAVWFGSDSSNRGVTTVSCSGEVASEE